jgi:hypothetical protein
MQMKYQQGLLQADRGIYLCSYMTAALPNESSHKTTKLIVMSSNYKIIEHRQTLGTFDINTMDSSETCFILSRFYVVIANLVQCIK